MKPMKLRWRFFLSLFTTATIAALFFRFLILEDFRVSSDSMVPTLLSGDLVFVSKSAFNVRLPFSSYELVNLGSPARGNVVAFSLPESHLETFVKRVVAIEGDSIAIRDGELIVNQATAQYSAEAGPKNSPLVTEQTPWGSYPVFLEKEKIKNYGPVTIPKGYFFALGDNRSASVDSRTWGPIPNSCLRGKVSFVWLSLNPAGSIRRERFGLWVQ